MVPKTPSIISRVASALIPKKSSTASMAAAHAVQAKKSIASLAAAVKEAKADEGKDDDDRLNRSASKGEAAASRAESSAAKIASIAPSVASRLKMHAGNMRQKTQKLRGKMKSGKATRAATHVVGYSIATLAVMSADADQSDRDAMILMSLSDVSDNISNIATQVSALAKEGQVAAARRGQDLMNQGTALVNGADPDALETIQQAAGFLSSANSWLSSVQNLPPVEATPSDTTPGETPGGSNAGGAVDTGSAGAGGGAGQGSAGGGGSGGGASSDAMEPAVTPEAADQGVDWGGAPSRDDMAMAEATSNAPSWAPEEEPMANEADTGQIQEEAVDAGQDNDLSADQILPMDDQDEDYNTYNVYQGDAVDSPDMDSDGNINVYAGDAPGLDESVQGDGDDDDADGADGSDGLGMAYVTGVDVLGATCGFGVDLLADSTGPAETAPWQVNAKRARETAPWVGADGDDDVNWNEYTIGVESGARETAPWLTNVPKRRETAPWLGDAGTGAAPSLPVSVNIGPSMSAGQVYTDHATIAAVQTALNKKYGCGLVVDGIFGPKTEACLYTNCGQHGPPDDSVLSKLDVRPRAAAIPAKVANVASGGDAYSRVVDQSNPGKPNSTTLFWAQPVWPGAPGSMSRRNVGLAVGVAGLGLGLFTGVLRGLVRR